MEEALAWALGELAPPLGGLAPPLGELVEQQESTWAHCLGRRPLDQRHLALEEPVG